MERKVEMNVLRCFVAFMDVPGKIRYYYTGESSRGRPRETLDDEAFAGQNL